MLSPGLNKGEAGIVLGSFTGKIKMNRTHENGPDSFKQGTLDFTLGETDTPQSALRESLLRKLLELFGLKTGFVVTSESDGGEVTALRVPISELAMPELLEHIDFVGARQYRKKSEISIG